MGKHLYRSAVEPIREGLTWHEIWKGADAGLIWCWERGRQERVEQPGLAARANKGELVMMTWRGGVESKLKIAKKSGTLKYLATWQGLRGEDLNIDLDGKSSVTCSKTGQMVEFSQASSEEE